ncbi:MAG: hypothetical protein ACM3SR_03740, partial [Ignavibacteriales bacterium]
EIRFGKEHFASFSQRGHSFVRFHYSQDSRPFQSRPFSQNSIHSRALGSQGADYSIRTTLSEGEISIAYPIKDEITASWTVTEKRISAEGLVFVETTTSERVHVENQTRVFDLYIDESQEQTERVLNAESEREDDLDPGLEAEAKIWRAAQTLIEDYRVYILYSQRLIEAFPKDKVRVRRDFQRLLSLIESPCPNLSVPKGKGRKGTFDCQKRRL